MKVERSDHHISGNFGTDEQSALKAVKSSSEKQSIDSVADKFAKGSTTKPSSESSARSELQHKVLGHEAKNEVSQFSQLKAAELTSKLNDPKSEELTKKFQSAEGSSRFSEMTEVLVPKDHLVPTDGTPIGGHTPREEKTSLLDRAKQTATEFGKSVWDAGTNLKQTAEKLVSSGEVNRPLDVKDVKDLASKMEKDVEKIGNIEVDPGKQIENMKDGDKITVGGGASVAVAEGAKISAKGTIELSKEGNKYKLSVDGETAASMGVGIAVGGKVEMSFDNPEEAKKALGLAQSGRIKDASAAKNFQAGGLTSEDFRNTANKTGQDAEFLKKHISAIEVRQAWIAEVPGMSVGKMGLPASAGGKAESTVRVEYENGKPKYMILKNSVNTETYPGGKGSVSVEQKFQVDENFPIGKLTSHTMQDPNNDLTPVERESMKKAMESAEYSVTVEGDMRYQGSTKGVGVRSQIKLTGKAKDFDNPETQEAIRQMVQNGKIKEGLKTIGNKVNVEGKAEVYESSGVEAKSPEIVVGVEVQATRQRVLASKSVTSKTATEAAEDLDRAVEEAYAKAKAEQSEVINSEVQRPL